MAIRVDYLARETGNNLVRNPTLTVATVLTVFVSLTLLGAALLIKRGVEGFNSHFKDDVEFVVWINVGADDSTIGSIEQFLLNSATVKEPRYIDEDETFLEFQTYFADQPEVLDLVNPDQLPTSFRVVPSTPDLAAIKALGAEIETLSGVQGVDYAEEYIKQLNDLTNKLSWMVFFAAVLSAIASSMLMYNTIRTGLFARRREIEVMRLVGATKWFIRLPFMFEGLLQGVLGGLFASAAIFGFNRLLASAAEGFRLLQSFTLGVDDMLRITVSMLAVGAVLGAVGAGIAVTKYLDA